MQQIHSIGKLRKHVEDVIVAHLERYIFQADVRPAMSGATVMEPIVVVHARNAVEMNGDSYLLARNLDVGIRVRTHGVDEANEIQPSVIIDAREAHFELVNQTCLAMVQADIVETLNEIGNEHVQFSSCYLTQDEGGIEGSSYTTTLTFEVLANPTEV